MAKNGAEKKEKVVSEPDRRSIMCQMTVEDWVEGNGELRGRGIGTAFVALCTRIAPRPVKGSPEFWAAEFEQFKNAEVK